MLAALAAFSDGCTIPDLTPTCPYYRIANGRPTCGEECRSLLSSEGVDRSPREIVVIDGLKMLGRPVPIEAAIGYRPFDATQQLLEDRGLPIPQRATGTLLLQLRSHAAQPPFSRSESDDVFYLLWQELTQRGLPVESVLRAAIAPAMAASLVRLLNSSMAYDLPEWQKSYQAAQLLSGYTGEAFARWFEDHAAEWLARLLDSDSQGFLSWRPAPASLLVNIPPPSGDGIGLWIWERFTLASVEDWHLTSVIEEWKFATGQTNLKELPTRTLKARRVERDSLAEAAMTTLAGSHDVITPPRDLSAGNFVTRAKRLLEAGRPGEAADIFAALAVVNPADGDALNNLGFCLVPTNPRMAISVLDRASSFPSHEPQVNVANRAFARHLLGDNDRALLLLAEASAPASSDPLLMWTERDCGEFTLTETSSLQDYVDHLAAHIRESIGETGPSLQDAGGAAEA